MEIEDYMKDLRLKEMKNIYRDEARRAAEENVDYTEYLHRLLEMEHRSKMERSVNYRIKRAGFSYMKTVEEYDFSCQPDLNEKLIRRLATQDYLDEAMNPIFVGPPGTGKTHLAIALGLKACENRKRVMFFTAQELVERLVMMKVMDRIGQELASLGRLDLLIIDELGYMKLNRENAILFFQLICSRYERGSIILTTNRPFDEWGEIFEDSVVATAVLDRLLHHSYIFYITGESYRMKEKKKTRKRNRKKE